MPVKRTYSDRAEYIKLAVKKRRRKIKLLSLEYKGSKCMICGYSRIASALEFHHLDAKTKEFAIGYKGATRSWVKVKQELDKCVLVCANCHREIHAGLTQPPAAMQSSK